MFARAGLQSFVADRDCESMILPSQHRAALMPAGKTQLRGANLAFEHLRRHLGVRPVLSGAARLEDRPETFR